MRLFGHFGRDKAKSKRILPRHIAIIMDGNGRWAKRRGLPRQAGHSAGARNFKKITRYCAKIGIKYLTIYVFSTENWKRPTDEVNGIMDLLRSYLKEALTDFREENIRMRFIGDISVLAPDIRQLIKETEDISRERTGMVLNLAVNYGGRQEITAAAKKLSADTASGKISPEDVDEELFGSYMYTAGQPDPDIIIRPSGEKRLSNFLLWQCAYTEFWSSDVLWPDFSTDRLEQAIDDYNSRDRRFGGI